MVNMGGRASSAALPTCGAGRPKSRSASTQSPRLGDLPRRWVKHRGTPCIALSPSSQQCWRPPTSAAQHSSDWLRSRASPFPSGSLAASPAEKVVVCIARPGGYPQRMIADVTLLRMSGASLILFAPNPLGSRVACWGTIMSEAHEHAEHIEHISHTNKKIALMIAVLALFLALSETLAG